MIIQLTASMALNLLETAVTAETQAAALKQFLQDATPTYKSKRYGLRHADAPA
jgi:predicted secreted protein